MLKKLMPSLKGYGKYALLTPAMVIIEVILEIFIPLIMANIIDIGVKNGDIGYVARAGAAMVLMAFFALIFGVLSGRFAAVASMGFAKGIRNKLFDKIQEFSFANIDRFSTASLITRLTTDVNSVQMAFMMIIRMLVRAPIMLISATIMTIIINARLAVVFLVAIAVLSAALYFIATMAYPRFRAMLVRYDSMNASVQENLIAIRVVKAFVREDHENEKFREAADAVRKAQLKAEKLVISTMPIMQFVMYCCMIAISWFGGRMIIDETLLTGEFMSFISYVGQIMMSLMMISFVFIGIVMSRASTIRIVEVIDEEIDIKDDSGKDDLKVEDGSVVFDNVSFSYSKNEENLTLSECSFEIKSGETVGIIGGTGSGKTSLVQLIPRLYDVLEGKVLVGGHDVRNYRLAALRDGVSVVLQKNVLFSGTIRENLRWGNENATDEEIEEACRAAQAHDFIMSFPKGYDTDLGQGGVNVSGGQKQRLSIARALLKKPKVIILDDSTSAVDTATDSKIRQALRENLKNTTKIIIAQRITSVSEADKIIVMDDGRINAVGTHEKLLAANSIYREVFESQQKGVV
ncbi:MAG TPA: ABC transporter ATP-binding protein [Bacillota bacterium]|nr:ABC transporter ATP-binding protein [Bacillota bacterium]